MEERVLLQSNCSLYRVTTKEELDSFSCGDYPPSGVQNRYALRLADQSGLRHGCAGWDRREREV